MSFRMNRGYVQLKKKGKHRLIGYLIALVWLVNGLFCKVLNLVPRHEEIVARILGDEYARPLTMLIGVSEILVAIWVVTGIRSKLNASFQIAMVASMNVIEFFLAPDLLLLGHMNALFALAFIGLIYYWEFMLGKSIHSPSE